MCGIWAIFGSQGQGAVQGQNFFRIAHRGPAGWRMEGVDDEQNHMMGYMATDPCMQPLRLCGQLDHLWLLFDGQIHNNEQIKEDFQLSYTTDMDGECLLHLYKKSGMKEALRVLDGTYSLVLLDTDKWLVHIARDVIGTRSLYKTHDQGFLGICSEAKGLVNLDITDNKDLDIVQCVPGTLETYTVNQRGSVTFMESVRIYDVGEIPDYALSLSDRITKMNQDDEGDICANIREMLTLAVRKNIDPSRNMGCLLSGGLGSSIVASLMVQESKDFGLSRPVHTFTVGMEGSVDILYARQVADHIGSEHTEIITTHDDLLGVIGDVTYFEENAEINATRDALALYVALKYINHKDSDMIVFTGDGLAAFRPCCIQAKDAEDADEQSRMRLKNLHNSTLQVTDKMAAASRLSTILPILDAEYISFYLSINSELRFPKDQLSQSDNKYKAISLKIPKKIKETPALAPERRQMNFPFLSMFTNKKKKSNSTYGSNGTTAISKKSERQTYILDENGLRKLDSCKKPATVDGPKITGHDIADVKQNTIESSVQLDLIQKAFSGSALVPEDVLMRPKMSFSQGILPENQTWEDTFGAYFDSQVSSVSFKKASGRFPESAPSTKEGYVYRLAFDTFYHGHETWLAGKSKRNPKN